MIQSCFWSARNVMNIENHRNSKPTSRDLLTQLQQMISTYFNHLPDPNWLTASCQVACSIWLLVQTAVRLSLLRAIIGHLSLMLPELDKKLLASCSRQGPFYHWWILKSCLVSDDVLAKPWICSTKRTTSSYTHKRRGSPKCSVVESKAMKKICTHSAFR